jgi:poly(A) polymerase
MGEAEQRRFLRVPGFADHLELQRLACVAAGEPLDAHEFARERLAALKEEDLYPLPLLTGDDLIAAGLTPGPAFARLLRKLEDAQLEGSVRTRDEALALITATRD